ncbi:hypothetical protein MTO96_023492 [Rhipicephalus appendiculatus]
MARQNGCTGSCVRAIPKTKFALSPSIFAEKRTGCRTQRQVETSDWTIYNWDPLMFVREQPMPFCLHRLRKDFANFAAQPPTGVYISPEEEDMTRVHALIVGPPGTPYEGGFFQFFMKFPPDYPIRPPRVRMVTTDAGRVSFNPNLYANGKVCLGILGTWEGPEWSPAQDIESVLVSIQSLMNEKPCNNEPALWPARSSFVKHYNDVVQHETIRVAVCGQVEAALKDSDECPSAFREPILRTFVDGYDRYEDIAKTRLIDCTGLMPKYLFKESRKYQYKQLLSRLRGLIDEARQRVNATSTSTTAEATSTY